LPTGCGKFAVASLSPLDLRTIFRVFELASDLLTMSAFGPLIWRNAMQITHAPVQPGQSSQQSQQSPARLARAAINDQPDLADHPFGKLVSAFARGETPTLTPSSTEPGSS
jgi:hypothetical protein